MDEHIARSVIRLDETVTFLRIEPFKPYQSASLSFLIQVPSALMRASIRIITTCPHPTSAMFGDEPREAGRQAGPSRSNRFSWRVPMTLSMLMRVFAGGALRCNAPRLTMKGLARSSAARHAPHCTPRCYFRIRKAVREARQHQYRIDANPPRTENIVEKLSPTASVPVPPGSDDADRLLVDQRLRLADVGDIATELFVDPARSRRARDRAHGRHISRSGLQQRAGMAVSAGRAKYVAISIEACRRRIGAKDQDEVGASAFATKVRSRPSKP